MSGDFFGTNSSAGPQASARRDSFYQHFLECGICLSIFHEPKALPCMHTFCKGCLASHIRSTASPIRPSFSCPTCKKLTTIPNPQAPPDIWADQFIHNFLIKNLINIVKGSSIENILQGKPCPKHLTKTLEFVCVVCNSVICSACASTTHHQCTQIIDLKDDVQEKRGSIGKFKQVFRCHKERSQLKREEQDKERRELQEKYAREKQNILQNSAKMMTKLKQEEQRCLQELENRFKEFDKDISSQLGEHDGEIQFLTKMIDASDTLLRSQDDFIVWEQHKTLEEYCDKISSYTANTAYHVQVKNLEFIPSQESVPTLGRLAAETFSREINFPVIDLPPPSPIPPLQEEQECAESMEPPPMTPPGDESYFLSVANDTGRLNLDKVMDTKKICRDKRTPGFRDAATVAGDVLVVTDEENMCIKSFYMSGSRNMFSKLIVEKKPHGITRYVGNMVAVTIPKAKQIAIISVTPNLILQNTIKTAQKYWPITAVNTDAFAVATCPGTGPITIDIITLEGVVLRTIHHGNSLFSNPLHMQTLATGDIMVSDCTVSTVACLRQDGHVRFHCQPSEACNLKKAMGMADDGKGYLFLVDKQPALVILDYNGKVKYVLPRTDGIKIPKAVAIGQRGKVYVVNETGKVGVFTVS